MVTAKPREVPPKIARAFFRAMRDYSAETDRNKRDTIAAHQLGILKSFQSPRERPLRLSDVKEMFMRMWDNA